MAELKELNITTIGGGQDIAEAKRINEKMRKLRQKASAAASTANKRADRLIEQGLKTPALLNIQQGNRFGIKGKTNAEVQSEYRRIQRFLAASTSTVRGAKKVIADTANRLGIKRIDPKTDVNTMSQIFRLFSKADEYLSNVQNIGALYSSDQTIEQVVKMVKAEKIDIANIENNLDEVVNAILENLEIERTARLGGHDAFFVGGKRSR